MAGQSNDAETLSTEMQTLVDQNSDLTRELVELRKERLSFHETKRLVENLEHLVAALHAEMRAAEQDATRLRRLNEELERKLEAEVVDSADARRLWHEKELHILTQLRSERDKAKTLRELGELKEDEEMAADAEATARRLKLSHRRSRLESGSGSPTPEEVAIKEHNAILARQVLELTERLRRRDNIAESQEQHILELQRTVAALMDDIESGHAQAEFEQLEDDTPPRHSLTPEPSAQPSEQLSPSSKGLTRSRSGAIEVSAAPTNDSKEAEPTKTFSLADELAKMNEASASDSSLRSRMAALGLSTEGNREALKRRLHKYIARKRRMAAAREEADGIGSGTVTAELFIERAKAYETLGHLDRALEDYRRASVIDPSQATESEIQGLLVRVAQRRAQAERDGSLAALVDTVVGPTSGGELAALEATRKLAALARDEGLARRLAADGGVTRLLDAVRARVADDGAVRRGDPTATVQELVAVLRLVVAASSEAAAAVVAGLDRALCQALVPLDDMALAGRSLELVAAAVRGAGAGWQDSALEPVRGVLEDCLKPGTRDELRLAVASTLIKASGDDQSCAALAQGPTLALALRLCGDANEQLRGVAPLLLGRLIEGLRGDDEARARTEIARLIVEWLNGSPREKSESLLALAAVFQARSTYGSAILLSAGFLDEVMDIIEYEPENIHVATVEVLSNACADQDCRKKIAARCVPFLNNMARSSPNNSKLRTMASGTLIKIMFADKDLENKMLADNKLAKSFIFTLKSDGQDQQAKLHAVEALAYLTLKSATKELVCDDTKLLKTLIALAGTEDRAMQFAVVSIFSNLTTYRRRLTEEEEQLMKLKEISGEGSAKLDPADDDNMVERRGARLLAAGVGQALSKAAAAATTAGLAEAVAQVYVNLATDKRTRGRLVQDGAVKALVGLTDRKAAGGGGGSDPAPLSAAAAGLAAHALAKIAITVDPNLAFKGQRAAELVRPLVGLCNGGDALRQFEALMALTNLASVDDTVRTRIVLAKGVRAMEYLQFSDHALVRRAATEALCNMMFEPSVFDSYAGAGAAPGRLRMMVALCDVDDEPTRRAASGALAILSSDPAACRALAEEPRGLDVLMGTIFGEENPEVLHRGVECVKNMAAVGGRLAQQLEAAGAVPALRLLVRNPHQEVAVGAVEALRNLQKAGVSVLAGKAAIKAA